MSAAKFFIFFLDLFLATMCASAIAFVVSASVGVFAVANIIVVLILILMMVDIPSAYLFLDYNTCSSIYDILHGVCHFRISRS